MSSSSSSSGGIRVVKMTRAVMNTAIRIPRGGEETDLIW